jgi:hypothetical protein
MSLKQYPPTHHRDAEHLREEFAAIHRLLRVCVDSLQLVNVLELVHTTEVLDELAERAWDAIEPAKALETVLFEDFTRKCEAQREQEKAEERAIWEANLPPGAVEAFNAVHAAYGIKSGEESQ